MRSTVVNASVVPEGFLVLPTPTLRSKTQRYLREKRHLNVLWWIQWLQAPLAVERSNGSGACAKEDKELNLFR